MLNTILVWVLQTTSPITGLPVTIAYAESQPACIQYAAELTMTNERHYYCVPRYVQR